MSPEELRQIALQEIAQEELEAEGSQEQQVYSPENTAPSVADMEAAKAGTEPSTIEAISSGIVEGMPFLKDASAAYDAIESSMEEDGASFDEAYGKYSENLNDANQALSRAKENSPWLFGAGQMAGTGAAFAAGGLAGAGEMATAVGVGAAQGLSESRDRGLSDVGVGADMGVGGVYASRAIGTVFKKAGGALVSKIGEKNIQTLKGKLGFKGQRANTKLNDHLSKFGQEEDDFLLNIVSAKYRDTKEPLFDFTAPPKILRDRAINQQRYIGEKVDDFYHTLKATPDNDINLNTFKAGLKEKLVDPIVNNPSKSTPESQQLAASTAAWVDDLGKIVKSEKTEVENGVSKVIKEYITPEKMSIKEVHSLQKTIRAGIKDSYDRSLSGKGEGALTANKQKITSYMAEVMQDTVASMPEGATLLPKLKSLNKQYSDISFLTKNLKKEASKDVSSSLFSMQDYFAAGIGAIGGLPGSAAAIAISKASRHPNTPLYLKQGLDSINNVIKAAPTGEMASRLSVAATVSTMEFEKVVYGAVAETKLRSEPIKRTTEDVQLRQQDIRNFLKDRQPETVVDFDKAVKDGPAALAVFMDGVSKIEGVTDMFEPGVGFDGRVYSDEDKATLELQLNQSDIPGAQRVQWINNLRANGVIPDMNSIVRAVPQKHIPRTKKVHDY